VLALPQVVGVRAVAHHGEPPGAGLRDEPAPQLGLAEKAAVGRVGEVARVVELVGRDLHERHVEPLGDRAGHPPLGRRIRGAAPDGRDQAIAAELLAQHHGEEGGIDPTRIAQ
jgi:hypothetical protein